MDMDMVVVAHPDMVDMGLREVGEVMAGEGVAGVAAAGEVAAGEVAAEGEEGRVGKVMAEDQRTGTTNLFFSNDLIPLSVLFFLVNPQPKPKPKPDPPPLLPPSPTLPLLVVAAEAATAKAVGKDRFHESTTIHPSSSSNDPNKSST